MFVRGTDRKAGQCRTQAISGGPISPSGLGQQFIEHGHARLVVNFEHGALDAFQGSDDEFAVEGFRLHRPNLWFIETHREVEEAVSYAAPDDRSSPSVAGSSQRGPLEEIAGGQRDEGETARVQIADSEPR